MRFRKGFVTNSSSTSFVCQFEDCENFYEGYDWDIPDYWAYCEKGHWFCSNHMPESDRKLFEKLNGSWYWVPEELCPVCRQRKLLEELQT